MSETTAARETEDDVISGAGARHALTVCTILGLIVGLALGYWLYGSLASVRAWNVFGLVLITILLIYGVLIGIRAWSNQCAIFREEERASS